MLEPLIEAIKASCKTPLLPHHASGQPFIVLKKGEDGDRIESLESLLQNPLRQRGCATLHDLDSFIEYVKERADTNSRIFADLGTAAMEAVFDFPTKDVATWGTDRATFAPKKRPEWSTWSNLSGRTISQSEFAEFIEDNMQNIVNPTGAEVLEVAKSLQARKKVDFKSGVNLDNGDVQLQYEETTEAKAGVKGVLTIPTEISLGLQPFEGAPSYAVQARLRYHIQEGRLTFTYKLRQADQVWQDAVKDAVTKIGTETGINVFLGSYDNQQPKATK